MKIGVMARQRNGGVTLHMQNIQSLDIETMITDFETDHFRFYLPQRAWDMLSLRLFRVIIVKSSAFMPSN